MDILFLILIGFACKSAFDHVKTKMGESRAASMKQVAKTFPKGKIPPGKLKAASRRHDLGYIAREIGRGFPVTRRGWHAGWIAHRTAAEQHRARLEEAKTAHGEAQASVLAELPDHKARQAEARKRRDEILAQMKGQPGEAKGSRKAVREAADELARKRAEKQQAAPGGPAPLPSETVLPEPGPFARPARVCSVCTHPGTADDPLVADSVGFAHRSHTERGEALLAAAREDPGSVRFSNWLQPGEPICETCEGRGRNADDTDACPDCRGWGSGPPDPDAPELPEGTICNACGRPGTADDPVLDQPGGTRLHRSHALADVRNQTDPTTTQGGPVTAGMDQGVLESGGESLGHFRDAASPATEGDTMTTATAETTYDQQITAANAIINESEQELARLRARQIGQMVEHLATLGLDSGSLGRAADIDDGLKAQIEAAQSTMDAATAFRDGLIRDHSAGNEYHQAAPQGGAEKAFFGG